MCTASISESWMINNSGLHCTMRSRARLGFFTGRLVSRVAGMRRRIPGWFRRRALSTGGQRPPACYPRSAASHPCHFDRSTASHPCHFDRRAAQWRNLAPHKPNPTLPSERLDQICSECTRWQPCWRRGKSRMRRRISPLRRGFAVPPVEMTGRADPTLRPQWSWRGRWPEPARRNASDRLADLS
jgi:hypothetical protein